MRMKYTPENDGYVETGNASLRVLRCLCVLVGAVNAFAWFAVFYVGMQNFPKRDAQNEKDQLI